MAVPTLSCGNVSTVVGTVFVAGLLSDSGALVAPATPSSTILLYFLYVGTDARQARVPTLIYVSVSVLPSSDRTAAHTPSLTPWRRRSERGRAVVQQTPLLLLLPSSFQSHGAGLVLASLLVAARRWRLGFSWVSSLESDPLTHFVPGASHTMTETRRVSYFYDAEVGNYHYGQGTTLSQLSQCQQGVQQDHVGGGPLSSTS